jgi:DNA-binding transcriptional MerR regulator
LKPYVLRFWEKEFPMLRPKKNRAGNRVYQRKDIDLVLRIKHLLYKEGFTIDGARNRIRSEQTGVFGGVTTPTILPDERFIRSTYRRALTIRSAITTAISSQIQRLVRKSGIL